ncbi:uncharacterized protein LOC119665768 [Teleopsis dalmanni]|uniref:uncharacterized protein LOC119665768 n=1 Tax=Teleopsis dalmanni TaxID=139649 RepID=UPI0018CEB310|nr:uncharacterized protein LOC119665768 [Teleopsis dalmanni]
MSDPLYRTSCRTQLTKLCNQINNYLNEPDNITEEGLAINLKRLQNAHEKLKKADEMVQDDKDFDIVIDYDDKAIAVIAKLEYNIQRLKISSNEPFHSDLKESIIQGFENSNNSNGVRLKPIELKKFNGAFESWLPFWEQFKVAVHDNKKLDAATKFNYLNEALVGEAAAKIAGFIPTEACYKDALNLLLEEYGDREKIIEKYIQIQPVHSSSNIKGLRKHIRIEVEALEKATMSTHCNADKRENDKTKTARGTAVGLYSSEQIYRNCIFCKRANHNTSDCKHKTIGINQKKNILKGQGRCFRCGKANHTSTFCKNQWIKCSICSGRHMSAICENKTFKLNSVDNLVERQSVTTTTEKPALPETSTSNSSAALNTMSNVGKNEVYLQTAKAIVSSDESKCLTRVIMDNGSQGTYVTEYLAKQLQLPVVGIDNTRIISFGQSSHNRKVKQIKRVILKVQSQYSDEIKEIYASVVQNICADVIPVPGDIYDKIKNMAENVVTNVKQMTGINLLIGQDNYWQFNSDNCEYITENLVAVETFFGWTIQGCSDNQTQTKYVLNVIEDSNDFDVSKFWDLESVGIKSYPECTKPLKKANLAKINGRYTVSLPWKYDKDVYLHNNKNNALNRLKTLSSKLFKDHNKLIEYDTGIHELIKSGIAEEVPDGHSNERTYYMPHRPVYREDKITTKMRIVFDASSSNPGMDPSMICLIQNDRDSHRFLWYKNLRDDNKSAEIATYRMARVTFGVTSSPFLLASTMQQHLQDDLIISISTVQEAEYLYLIATKIMKIGGFNLRKWTSNSEDLRRKFEENNKEQHPIQKVLGVLWNIYEDNLFINLDHCIEISRNLRPTKRNVLKIMAGVYDPLGFLGPFTVKIKTLLQRIWKENLDWDSTLPESLADDFNKWCDDLHNLKYFTISRCLMRARLHTELLHTYEKFCLVANYLQALYVLKTE